VTDDAPVLFERIDTHIALVTLNRPEVHNAVNGAVARMLNSYALEIEADPAIRVAILAANGASFCAGLDLKMVAEGHMYDAVVGDAGFAGFVFLSRTKPWIAAVQGMALGGGTELSLACDLVVAGANAQFGLPEVKRGLIAGAGGCIRIAQAVPRALAIEMVTTGMKLSAERAFGSGLASRLVQPGEEVATALELARAIAANAPVAVRESLRVVRSAVAFNEREMRALQDESVKRVLASPDVAEGARAFVEKRPAVWVS